MPRIVNPPDGDTASTVLEPRTEAGWRCAELARRHAEHAATVADVNDRDAAFPFDVFSEMRRSGLLRATVPEAFGGIGVESFHDLAVVIATLARGDGSTALAATMHLVYPPLLTWLARSTLTRDDGATTRRVEDALRALGRGDLAMGNATERGTDLARPRTEARRAPGGWNLNGHKIFGTLAPIADWFIVSCRLTDGGRDYRAFAIVRRGSTGQHVEANWDALGMRASGSPDITYRDCFVPDERFVATPAECGAETAGLCVNACITAGSLIAVFLGIAEAARAWLFDGPRLHRSGEVDHLLAEIEVDLYAIQAVVQSIGDEMDRALSKSHAGLTTLTELEQLAGHIQCAKWFVNERAARIVDRAMTLTGGAAYMARHPLARLYRDVRAGPFMQPHSPKEAPSYIAATAFKNHGRPYFAQPAEAD